MKITNVVAGTLVATFVVATTAVLIILGLLISGFTLQCLWAWFLVPLGLPELGLVHAMGLGLLTRWLTWQKIDCQQTEKTEKETIVQQLIFGFVYPLGVLGIGFVLQLFM